MCPRSYPLLKSVTSQRALKRSILTVLELSPEHLRHALVLHECTLRPVRFAHWYWGVRVGIRRSGRLDRYRRGVGC